MRILLLKPPLSNRRSATGDCACSRLQRSASWCIVRCVLMVYQLVLPKGCSPNSHPLATWQLVVGATKAAVHGMLFTIIKKPRIPQRIKATFPEVEIGLDFLAPHQASLLTHSLKRLD